jgi:hypothetical protein
MAMMTRRGGTSEALKWPPLDDEAIDRIAVRDESTIDSLYLHLVGTPLPAVWDPRDEDEVWIGLRLDDGNVTNEVVGIMVENFRLAALQKHPEWAKVLTGDHETRRQAVRELVAAVADMPAGDEVTQG